LFGYFFHYMLLLACSLASSSYTIDNPNYVCHLESAKGKVLQVEIDIDIDYFSTLNPSLSAW